MNAIQLLVPDQVPRELVRGDQSRLLGIKDNSRDLAAQSTVDAHLFDRRAIAEVDKAHNVVPPVVLKTLLDVPTDLMLEHLFCLVCRVRPIVASGPIQSKSQSAGLATVTPPRDLRTQLHPATEESTNG